ncbi:uncharacterized CRM domain-containing protein At3g25440, chloroplastic [Cynara cardunculus var. scolymus]|uniref:uncharacterized CRM domain-containing protein At3g25440, chloroplastic n=1 Tax=Cynara cardunculus var. scolymus TaxID=59895 RepID=UPI000D62F206|nr:uncharacterized CRM domain-containing protein At3g25440, chloroplastic [Cynara cardunculus var. scolymus]XP_024975418.1 uncharacterized CRM domain-containing protein At3g25440, chloroplastic [Cynara cardunculus var. scolymus]
MFATKNLQKRCFQTLTSRFITNCSKDVKLLRGATTPNFTPTNDFHASFVIRDEKFLSSINVWNCFDGRRTFSTARGRSMRSKVEMRMKKESGKTLREIRRAKKIQKKLMTDEERLIYNLKRAKKKVALLLQKLKKYELPELPAPRHDPELLTPEQIQALKKIGFRNRNYVPVGVRGVFGGVVQNMHMHWKFHETVQVCCDNFPKEKIKEMATMLARLSGGIVVNIHNVKTIIMFRGRNYRQPKNLIPINTLTKRKALFKARFEQALESQKLNIKKIEQQLRRMNVNPDDPVAMASIQRVASTFFNAIDKKEGSPYVFRGDKPKETGIGGIKESESGEDSDQEELDKFIAEIEDAADREWEEEEAAEKEEVNRIRYLYREDYDGRYTKPDMGRRAPQRSSNSENDEVDEDDENDSDEAPYVYDVPKVERWKRGKNGNSGDGERFSRRDEGRFGRESVQEEPESEDMLDDLENVMFESDEEKPNIGNEDKFSNGHGKDDFRNPEILILESEEEEPESRSSAKIVDEKWDSD